MAQTYALKDRIDARLRSMRNRLEALPLHEEQFGSPVRPDMRVELAALEEEWRDGLDRLDWLHQHFVHGEMSPEQAQKHRQNLGLLKKYQPILVKLGLALPTGALAAALASPEVASVLAELV